MNTFKKTFGIAACVGILAVSATPVFGAAVFLFTFDENGNGFLNGQTVPWTMAADPISGITTLTYNLPIVTAAGDVVLEEQGGLPGTAPTISDIVRFDGQGNVYFFSDMDGPPFDLADVRVLPNPINPLVVIPEVGPEGNNGALWTPGAGQPGFDVAGIPITYTYNIISDVPEPGSMLLAGLSGGLMLLMKLRRQAKRA